MAEKSDWRKNIQHYLDENPDWDYRQAEQQAFIDAALQVGEASFGGWLTGSFMGGGYSKIQNIADRFQKSRQAYVPAKKHKPPMRMAAWGLAICLIFLKY